MLTCCFINHVLLCYVAFALPCLVSSRLVSSRLVSGGGVRTHGRASVLSRTVELGLCILPEPSVASLDTRE
jgi:hypothetical protein